MSKFRWGMGLAVAMLFTGVAFAEDGLKSELADIRAKLAAQESAVMAPSAACGNEADGLISLKKKAVVKVGGKLNVRYFARSAKATKYENTAAGVTEVAKYKTREGELKIADANLFFDIAVTDTFGAFIDLDLESSHNEFSDNAKAAYLYWKNICNTGFGLNVGRKTLEFGLNDNPTVMSSYVAKGDDGYGSTALNGPLTTSNGVLVSGSNVILAPHARTDVKLINQVNLFWEGMDGKIRADLTLFQNKGQAYGEGYDSSTYARAVNVDANGNYTYAKYRSHDDVLLRSGAFRLIVTPIEDLNIAASVVNYYNGALSRGLVNTSILKKNDTQFGLAANYRPAFFNKLKIWTEWIHGMDVANVRKLRSDAVTLGLMFDVNEQLSVFATGDYLRIRDKNGVFGALLASGADRQTAWAGSLGVQYRLAEGALLETGWKHEEITNKNRKLKIGKAKADTIYTHVGFEF